MYGCFGCSPRGIKEYLVYCGSCTAAAAVHNLVYCGTLVYCGGAAVGVDAPQFESFYMVPVIQRFPTTGTRSRFRRDPEKFRLISPVRVNVILPGCKVIKAGPKT